MNLLYLKELHRLDMEKSNLFLNHKCKLHLIILDLMHILQLNKGKSYKAKHLELVMNFTKSQKCQILIPVLELIK